MLDEKANNVVMSGGCRTMQGRAPAFGPLFLGKSIQLRTCLEEPLHFIQISSCSRIGEIPLFVTAASRKHQGHCGNDRQTWKSHQKKLMLKISSYNHFISVHRFFTELALVLHGFDESDVP